MFSVPGAPSLQRSASGLAVVLLTLALGGPPARAAAPASTGLQGSATPASSTPSLGEALAASGPEQLALSDHLRSKGALFYGAWWCPACFKQKNLFGKEAGNRLPYVECEKTQSDRERCLAVGIRAYPTWILGNQRIEGVQTIEELKQWSGFPSSTPAPRTPQ